MSMAFIDNCIVYAKTQYLQCWPFSFKTSSIRPGMLSINFWAKSWLMAAHSCIINAWSKSEFVGFCLSTHLLRIDNKFSMGLRSGEFPGHGPKMSMFCSSSHLVITFALWQGALSCWKRRCSSPNFSWIVGRSYSQRTLLCHSKKFGHGCRTDNVLKGCEWIPLIWPVKGPSGLMDKASAFGAEDCGFESHLGRL